MKMSFDHGLRPSTLLDNKQLDSELLDPRPVPSVTHVSPSRLLLFATLCFLALCSKPVIHRDMKNPVVLIQAHYGAVASENKVCSDLGVDTLKAGGNAVDAAISTTFCIGVINMFS